MTALFFLSASNLSLVSHKNKEKKKRLALCQGQIRGRQECIVPSLGKANQLSRSTNTLKIKKNILSPFSVCSQPPKTWPWPSPNNFLSPSLRPTNKPFLSPIDFLVFSQSQLTWTMQPGKTYSNQKQKGSLLSFTLAFPPFAIFSFPRSISNLSLSRVWRIGIGVCVRVSPHSSLSLSLLATKKYAIQS
jgi:hypothetical protein